MSSGGTSTAAPQEPQTFKRAVRKIKCAAMVASLAKSWQGWANEHTDKQDTIPSGWMPSSVQEEDKKLTVKLTVTPRVITAEGNETGGSKIRTCSVTKTVQPKRSECSSSDVVNAIRGKMESGPEDSKPFLGNESPTRRRQMRALQNTGGGGGGIQDRKLMLQEKKLGSRNSSVDTEDSGLGEDGGLSDNSESKTEQSDVQPRSQRSKVDTRPHDNITHYRFSLFEPLVLVYIPPTEYGLKWESTQRQKNQIICSGLKTCLLMVIF